MMGAQWPADRKRAAADWIIENDGPMAALEARARAVFDAIAARAAST